MGLSFGKLFSRLFAILMVGLDAAGKTTIWYKLKLGEIVTTIPKTVVAKWDEEVSPFRKMGSKSEGKSIGYVGDEWDEEYDRGKKKKIRMMDDRTHSR